jgi:hypothetical protein
LDNKNADTSAINAKNLDNEGVICQLITKTFERNFLAHFNFEEQYILTTKPKNSTPYYTNF